VLAGELRELDVPASLSLLLAARLDALGSAERAFVRGCRCLAARSPGRPRPHSVICPTVRLSTLVRKQVLMIRADPLSPDRGQYTFAQSLLRQVAYEMLSRRERKPRHLAAAEHLRHVFANDAEDVAEISPRTIWRRGGPPRATPISSDCAQTRSRRCAARRSAQ